ncbi:hypothetical protein J6S35_03120, partial [Candidatus Saccharibacteria bacterium]|nr:hypothetical protein [Candidatus Saccharibacteria bacterium]
YNWYTATATYGGYNTTTDTSYSICPKGWRLPKDGGSGEFQALRNVYSSSAFGDDWRNTPLNFIFAGNRSGGSTNNASTSGNYWSSTASNNNFAYHLDLMNSSNVYLGINAKFRGLSVRCIAEQDFWSITYMQQMTPELANSVTAPTDSSVTTLATTSAEYNAATPGSVVPQRTLTDSRDSKTYTIRKLADGRVWMAQNLRLVGPISASDLNPANTNVTSRSTFALTASNSGTWCTTNSSACDDQSMVLDSGNDNYGAYYNWYAATAGTGTYETTTDTSYSICPKGWRLPKGGDSGEFQTLYGKYNSSTLLSGANGPNFTFAGWRIGGSMSYTGTESYNWSNTAYYNHSAYTLYLSIWDVYPARNAYKYQGSTVRCINAN